MAIVHRYRSAAGRWLLYLSLLSFFSYGLLLFMWSSDALSPVHSSTLRSITYSNDSQLNEVKALPMGDSKERKLRCIGWRATMDCTPFGPRDKTRDQPCRRTVCNSESGYCEVEDIQTGERFQVMRRHCTSLFRASRLKCDDALKFVDFRVKARKAVEKALVPGFALPNVKENNDPKDGIVIVVYPK